MIRSGTGAATTPPSSQRLQARFSRLVTTTKYFAGSTSSCSLISWPMTTVAWPQTLQVHCSGAQAMVRSTRGKPAGSCCRPGCLRLLGGLAVAGSGSRPLSAWTSAWLTPGSKSSNWSCASLSFSLPGPYLLIRCNRSCSSKTWILNSAQTSFFCNSTICSVSDSGLGKRLATSGITKSNPSGNNLQVTYAELCGYLCVCNWSHVAPVPLPSLGTGQINAPQQQRQFLVTEHDLRFLAGGLRPPEASLLQALGTHPQSTAVPEQQFQTITLRVGE